MLQRYVKLRPLIIPVQGLEARPFAEWVARPWKQRDKHSAAFLLCLPALPPYCASSNLFKRSMPRKPKTLTKAASRLLVAGMEPGRRGPPRSDAAQLAALVSYVRRQLSITAVREQARMLLERLQLLGDGSADAARRRERATAAEAKASRERKAQLVCLRQGRAIMRHGFGKLH